tara:strand:- start:377 stop:589 length:213 start_codon:yes stop_codon:yes gene_type:complete
LASVYNFRINIKNLIKLDEKDGINFELSSKLETNYPYEYFRKELELSRFDEVSSAIQNYSVRIPLQTLND